ncbi:hypothetical protein WJX82_004825 [Trebouxia sp. C0006]
MDHESSRDASASYPDTCPALIAKVVAREQKAVGQSGVGKPEVQPCNQHNKHAQEKAVPKFRVKWFELLAMNKNLVADNKTLQTENHELSQSLHDQRALNAKMHEELQCLQNNLNMRRAALASKDKQLLQVNIPVLNYLDATDTLEAGYTTSMVTQMYTDDIQAPVKAIFNILKKDYPTVPQTMFQHNSGVGDSSEGNTSVLGSIQRKLFLDAVNIELDRAVWGLHTIFDAVFKPFASKQQVLLNIQDVVGQQHPEDFQSFAKTMVNCYLGLHRELCKFWREGNHLQFEPPKNSLQTLSDLADNFCHRICGDVSKEALQQVRPHMQNVLAGALRVRVATETLHPLYRLYVPQGIPEGVCKCPGIVVTPDVCVVSTPNWIILQAEVESLQ